MHLIACEPSEGRAAKQHRAAPPHPADMSVMAWAVRTRCSTNIIEAADSLVCASFPGAIGSDLSSSESALPKINQAGEEIFILMTERR